MYHSDIATDNYAAKRITVIGVRGRCQGQWDSLPFQSAGSGVISPDKTKGVKGRWTFV